MDFGTFFPETNGFLLIQNSKYTQEKPVAKVIRSADLCCLRYKNIARKDFGEAFDEGFRRFRDAHWTT